MPPNRMIDTQNPINKQFKYPWPLKCKMAEPPRVLANVAAIYWQFWGSGPLINTTTLLFELDCN